RFEAFFDLPVARKGGGNIEAVGNENREQMASAGRLGRFERSEIAVARAWNGDIGLARDAAHIGGADELIGIKQRNLAVGVDVEDDRGARRFAAGFENNPGAKFYAVSAFDADVNALIWLADQARQLSDGAVDLRI